MNCKSLSRVLSARLAALVAGSCLSAAAMAGPGVTITPIVMELDSYGFAISSGFGASENHAVNNSGTWLVESDTTNPDTDADGLIIRGTGHILPSTGTVIFNHAQPLTLPAGATLSSFDSITMNASGNSAFNFFLDGLTSTTDSGVYFNDMLVIQEGAASTATGFSANTPYTGFLEVRINDQDQILVVAAVDDSAVASTTDRALVLIDNPTGAFTETVIAKEGDELIPGRFVVDFSNGPHNVAFRNNSRTIFIADMDGDTLNDGLICQYDGADITVLAREGDPSPVAGRNWGSLIGVPVDINNSGQWAMRGDLDGAVTTDDSVIVRNGTDILAREGDPIPAEIGTETFTGFGTGGLAIADNGDVIYVALWTGDTTTNTGIFVNNTLLVQKGVTTVDGLTVTAISTVQDNISASPDGRWIIFEGALADGREGAFLIERDLPDCPADYDGNGTVEVLDIFEFLTDWFDEVPAAYEFGGDPGVPAIFAFLTAWFAGCP